MIYPMVSIGPQAPTHTNTDVGFCPNPPAPYSFNGGATKVEANPEEYGLPLAGVTGREGKETSLRGVASVEAVPIFLALNSLSCFFIPFGSIVGSFSPNYLYL